MPQTPILEPLDEFDLREFLSLLLRRKRTIAVCLLLSISFGVLTSLATTPEYRSTTTLEIEPDMPRIFNFDELLQVDATADSFYQTQYRLIASRSVAARVIDTEGLLSVPEFVGKEATGRISRSLGWLRSLPSRAASAVRDLHAPAPLPAHMSVDEEGTIGVEGRVPSAAIAAFLARLSVEPIRSTRLVEISWTSTSPVLAARVTNAVARSYIAMNLEAKFATTEQASQFLASEVGRLQTEIAEAQASLQRYGGERDILSLDERQDTVTQTLSNLAAEYTRTQTDRVQKQTSYEQLAAADPSGIPEVFTNALVVRLKSDLATLQQQHSEMSRRFTDDWPEMQRLSAQMGGLEERIIAQERTIFDGLVNSANTQYAAAVERERSVEALLEEQRVEATELNRNLLTYRSLQNEIDKKQELMGSLVERQSETGVSARLQGMAVSNVRVVDPATTPTFSFRPSLKRSLVLAAMVGLMLGVCLVFLQDHWDNTLQSAEDVERRIGAPSLGLVASTNSIAGTKQGSRFAYVYGIGEYTQPIEAGTSAELIAAANPRSVLAEAYRSVRTSVLLSTAGEPPKVILVTSAVPGEGKTTSAVNLAVSFAQTGKRVLVIDGDLRRPRLHSVFDLDSDRGLVHYLTGSVADLQDLVHTTRIENLWALPCGPRPPDPAELLGSDRARALFRTIRESFDLVVIDSPPMLAVADPAILVPLVDGVVLVAHGGTTPHPVVGRAKQRIEEVHGRVIGVLLNNVDLRDQGYYSYSRGYLSSPSGQGSSLRPEARSGFRSSTGTATQPSTPNANV